MRHLDEKAIPEAAEQIARDILIVEDEPMIMDLMIMVISRAGHRVFTATNGSEAIGVWEIERPQIILMDVQMPILDGLDATKWIRAREEEIGGHVAIYGLTAHVMEDDINRCLEAGMTGHISKPINFQEVRAAIMAAQKK